MSLVDKMAGKGVIHRNAAARYCSAKRSVPPRTLSRHRRAAQLHHQPFEQNSRVAA
jgi:ribosomal protein S20